MPSLTIRLPEHAAAALQDLAQVECRTPRDQAAFLILEGLRAAAPAAVMAAGQRRRRGRPLIGRAAASVRSSEVARRQEPENAVESTGA
jgi:hypothetical protein